MVLDKLKRKSPGLGEYNYLEFGPKIAEEVSYLVDRETTDGIVFQHLKQHAWETEEFCVVQT